MRAAQGLYEQGFITYMRTDSTALSDEGMKASRSEILDRFGKEYLPEKGNIYSTKVKNAQEAHEAIRPTSASLTPEKLTGHSEEEVKLLTENAKHYQDNWKKYSKSIF